VKIVQRFENSWKFGGLHGLPLGPPKHYELLLWFLTQSLCLKNI
jgi:hypothetical protein